MEGASVFEILAWKILPEYQERFSNWIMSVYFPLGIKLGRKGTERYQIVKENPDYLKNISIMYYEDFEAMVNFQANPEVVYMYKDLNITYGPRREVVWGAAYQVLKSFRKNPADTPTERDDGTENTPVVHIEGYRLSLEDMRKYNSWFAKWGYGFYLPAIMKLPGLQEYNYCRILDFEQPEIQRPKDPSVHPTYLSVLQFENLKAFENYEKSMELAAFREAMKIPFPGGLNFHWYVQYQLMGSWK
jgi:hypothetical protein